MASSGRIIAIICGLIMMVACVGYIVSNAVPQWGSITTESEKATVGLWSTCGTQQGLTVCLHIPSSCPEGDSIDSSVCGKMMASRVFVTIACIISGLSALCLFACGILSPDSNRAVITISKILPLLSFVAGIIGVVVGIVFITTFPIKLKLTVAAIIGIIAVVINAIGAISAFMIR